MEQSDMYTDMARRTHGDIYIGVVGPVRTGKSTFIKRFMELMVLGHMEDGDADEAQLRRLIDELPQSGSGRTIMTTQPRFIPNEAVRIGLSDKSVELRVRLVDCVGYPVAGALGTEQDGAQRMVRTPWFEHDIPFEQAAELGTRKVIEEHSTLGIVVTTDGSIAGIEREAYVQAEERAISELSALGKPFAIVLNSRTPDAPATQKLREQLAAKYAQPVVPLNVLEMTQAQLLELMEQVLYEFPVTKVHFGVPDWLGALDESHWLVGGIIEAVRERSAKLVRMRDHTQLERELACIEIDAGGRGADGERKPVESACKPVCNAILLGDGSIDYDLPLSGELFYRVLGEECGTQVAGERQLLGMMRELTSAKREYDYVANALRSVRETGYGLVMPTQEELKLGEPEVVRQGGLYGVRIKATAPSLHMVAVDVQTEVSPIVGAQKQADEMARFLTAELENEPDKVWDTNMFGKTLSDMVREGMQGKMQHMPPEAREKVRAMLAKVINEGNGGMICILL